MTDDHDERASDPIAVLRAHRYGPAAVSLDEPDPIYQHAIECVSVAGTPLGTVTVETPPRFRRPEPYTPPDADLDGFGAGVLRVAWARPAESFEIPGRAGRMYAATLTECRTRTGSALSDHVRAALLGLIVRSPEGALARVAGVEMFCTMGQMAGSPVGLLLVPVEEP